MIPSTRVVPEWPAGSPSTVSIIDRRLVGPQQRNRSLCGPRLDDVPWTGRHDDMTCSDDILGRYIMGWKSLALRSTVIPALLSEAGIPEDDPRKTRFLEAGSSWCFSTTACPRTSGGAYFHEPRVDPRTGRR